MPKSDPYVFKLDYYDVPNRLDFVGDSDPVSLQNRNGDKRNMMEALSKVLADHATYMFSGDVEVQIDWFISPEERYNTHKVADLDNIVKPLLDAITGPDGVLIDDNQVQSLVVKWVEPYDPNVRLKVSVVPEIDDRILREGLFFVEFAGRGCFPFNSELVAKIQVPYLAQTFENIQYLLDIGIMPAVANQIQPLQRCYPRARISNKFKIRSAHDYLNQELTQENESSTL